MSGGYFDYEQYKLGRIADEIEQLIRSNNDLTLNEYGEPKGRQYNQETIKEFHRAIWLLEVAEVYAQRIDWLVSGDDSEDSFHERLKEDLKKLDK